MTTARAAPVDNGNVCVNVDPPGSRSATSRRRRRSTTSPTRRTKGCSSPPRRCRARPGWPSCSPPWPRTARTGPPTGRTCSATTPWWSTAGPTPTTATSPRAARAGPTDRASPTTPHRLHGAEGLRRVEHARRCSTPASARSSTPACWPAPNPEGGPQLVESCCRTRSRRRCRQHVRLPGLRCRRVAGHLGEVRRAAGVAVRHGRRRDRQGFGLIFYLVFWVLMPKEG